MKSKKTKEPSMWDKAQSAKRPSEAENWEKILGADVKAELDERIKQPDAMGGLLSPCMALYWHTLQQARMQPCPNYLLLAVAQSIQDGTALIQEITKERNQVAAEGYRARVMLQRAVVDARLILKRKVIEDAKKTAEQVRLDIATIQGLSESEALWLQLRMETKNKNTRGQEPVLSQREIAEAMGTGKENVYRLEKQMESRADIMSFLNSRGVKPRKVRGIPKRVVTK